MNLRRPRPARRLARAVRANGDLTAPAGVVYTQITGLQIEFTGTGREIQVELFLPYVRTAQTTSGVFLVSAIRDGFTNPGNPQPVMTGYIPRFTLNSQDGGPSNVLYNFQSVKGQQYIFDAAIAGNASSNQIVAASGFLPAWLEAREVEV